MTRLRRRDHCRVDRRRGSLAVEQRWQLRSKRGRLHPFKAHDPNAPLLKSRDQLHDRVICRCYHRQVENHRAASEESWRPCEPGIKLGEPLGNRTFGCEHEGHVRASKQAHWLMLTNYWLHGRSRLPAMVINCQAEHLWLSVG